MTVPSSKNKALVICGPTATGKTKLALDIAYKLGSATIISVDSRQAYQGLSIVSGQDVPAHLPNAITLFGQNIFAPDEPANVAEFVTKAWAIINASQKPLIIVGGTGLYLKALTTFLPDIFIPPNPDLRQELEKLSLVKLQDKLKLLSAEKFNQLNQSDLNNPRRLIRHIEVSIAKKPTLPTNFPPLDYHWIGIKPNSISTLKQHIANRVRERLDQGALTEVQQLLSRFPDRHLPIYSALGVPQIINHLDGKTDLNELIDTWVQAELNYAKRQMVWFKKQPSVIWYDLSDVQDQTSSLSQYLS